MCHKHMYKLVSVTDEAIPAHEAVQQVVRTLTNRDSRTRAQKAFREPLYCLKCAHPVVDVCWRYQKARKKILDKRHQNGGGTLPHQHRTRTPTGDDQIVLDAAIDVKQPTTTSKVESLLAFINDRKEVCKFFPVPEPPSIAFATAACMSFLFSVTGSWVLHIASIASWSSINTWHRSLGA